MHGLLGPNWTLPWIFPFYEVKLSMLSSWIQNCDNSMLPMHIITIIIVHYYICSYNHVESIFNFTSHIIQAHAAICHYALIKCINTGCGQKLRRLHMEQHSVTCEFAPNACSWCSKTISKHDLEVGESPKHWIPLHTFATYLLKALYSIWS